MRFGFLAVLGLIISAPILMPPAIADETIEPSGLHIDLSYHTLDNGLRVVLAEDDTVPTATVGVYYGVGFRNEPPGQTGFAHLFEHLFFRGSRHTYDEGFHSITGSVGGISNGSTRLDFTNYFSVVPSNALQTLLWAEADRMAYPSLTQASLDQEREVVRNEIFVNVLNQPFGGASWIDLPMAANQNWHNAHNFYGDLSDLDSATVKEATEFFRTYYAPNNAVLVVAGSFDHAETLAYIDTLFTPIPAGEALPEIDVSEPRQEIERRSVLEDELANQPGFVIGYHMPERGSPEYFAMVILDQLLNKGGDGLLRQHMVDETGLAARVGGGINLLGNPFNYDGPILWTVSVMHDDTQPFEEVLAAFDDNIENLRADLISETDLRRARSKFMAGFYAQLDYSTRFGLVDLLASFALFDDDPSRINNIHQGFEQVTPELIRSTALEYLRPGNRTVLQLVPIEADIVATDTSEPVVARSKP